MRDWDPKRNHNNDRRPIRIIRMPLLPLFECQPFYYQNHVPMSVFFCATSARYWDGRLFLQRDPLLWIKLHDPRPHTTRAGRR